MGVAFKDRQPVRMVALVHEGAPHELKRSFDALVAWAGPKGLLHQSRHALALYLTNMMTTPVADQRSYAGFILEEGEVVTPEAPFLEVTVPGGRHAMTLYRGPYAELGVAWSEVYAAIAAQGETPADQPPFEINLNNPRTTAPEDLLTEIWVPLAKSHTQL